MRGDNRILFVLMAALLPAFGCGCISEQHSEFRGVLARGTTASKTPSVQDIAEEFQHLPPSSAKALTGFGLSPSGIVIVFVHDRQKYVNNDYRLANDAVSGVYFYDRNSRADAPWMKFLGVDAATRDESESTHRFQGSFNVERWKSNIDFRIRLAMQSAGPDPLTVDGVLTTYNRWEFHPWRATGIILGSMGLISEGVSQPKTTSEP